MIHHDHPLNENHLKHPDEIAKRLLKTPTRIYLEWQVSLIFPYFKVLPLNCVVPLTGNAAAGAGRRLTLKAVNCIGPSQAPRSAMRVEEFGKEEPFSSRGYTTVFSFHCLDRFRGCIIS